MIIDHLWTTWSLSEVANTVSCSENSVVFLIIVIIMIKKIIVIIMTIKIIMIKIVIMSWSSSPW